MSESPYVRVRLDYDDFEIVPWTTEATLDDKLVRAADYDALHAEAERLQAANASLRAALERAQDLLRQVVQSTRPDVIATDDEWKHSVRAALAGEGGAP